jgi:uncharacterized protein (DUF2461 family)
VEATGRALESITSKARQAALEVYGSDPLKTAPRGYPKDHPRVELLRGRGLVVMKAWAPAAWLGTAAAKARVVDVFRAAGPLLSWLDDNVGPAEGAE